MVTMDFVFFCHIENLSGGFGFVLGKLRLCLIGNPGQERRAGPWVGPFVSSFPVDFQWNFLLVVEHL